MQTRKHSLFEVLTNTFTGTIGSYLITFGVMAWNPFNQAVNAGLIVVLCTVWPLFRGYTIRRHFNKMASKRAEGGVAAKEAVVRLEGEPMVMTDEFERGYLKGLHDAVKAAEAPSMHVTRYPGETPWEHQLRALRKLLSDALAKALA